jgi:hypothetical protein
MRGEREREKGFFCDGAHPPRARTRGAWSGRAGHPSAERPTRGVAASLCSLHARERGMETCGVLGVDTVFGDV